jgi:cytochrome o ubiquinol oxidase subunit 2
MLLLSPPLAPSRRRLSLAPLAPLALLPLLGGCNMIVLNPAGDIARQQANLVLASVGLMLLIVLPVMAATVFFAWRYRASNKDATYEPDWDHSTGLELMIWAAPLLIIIMLGALTWISTHTLDPYRPLGRLAPGKTTVGARAPLEIQVVALDWKWLFIYPEQGVATVNALVLPTDRQVRFRITSSAVMNSFYVPALAGQIYAMPGMETKLHAVLNRPGKFEGFSANYSGAGFSGMHFVTQGVDAATFDAWAARMRAKGGTLSGAEYMNLEKPSENTPVIRYASVMPGLFDKIVSMCVKPGTPCMADTMRHDMAAPKGEGHPKPINDSGVGTGPAKPKGALQKEPLDKGTAPHWSKPIGPQNSPGSAAPGTDANRNMTQNDQPILGRPVAVRS